MKDPGPSDEWSRWLRDKRFGGDADYAEKYLKALDQVRDAVLDGAKLVEGSVLLDVGAGDGLIAFGALNRVGATGRVIFADVSEPLLAQARAVAKETGVIDRCDFVRARAEELLSIPDASVDAVTTRSVLIYVADKVASFREFHRVLKTSGRIALFEPINRYWALTESPTRVCGIDIPAAADLAQRLWTFYRQLQPLETDPMMNFDERVLVTLAEAAGFVDIVLTLRIFVRTRPPMTWKVFMNASGNPHIPSLSEAIAEVFTADEAARFEGAVRPIVEAGTGIRREAFAFLMAGKRAG